MPWCRDDTLIQSLEQLSGLLAERAKSSGPCSRVYLIEDPMETVAELKTGPEMSIPLWHRPRCLHKGQRHGAMFRMLTMKEPAAL